MAFVQFNENGEIIASADWAFPGSERVEYEIVHGNDGKLYKSGEEPVTSIDEIKESAKQALKAHRQSIEHGGVIINGQKWDTEVKDEVRLLEQLFLSGASENEMTVNWKIADGVYIELTPEILNTAVTAFKNHFERCFEIEAMKLLELDALETEEEINEWLTGAMLEGWE